MADAIDESTLRKALREKDEFLVSCREVDTEKKAYKMKNMELSDFSREIENMLASGITVIRGVLQQFP